MRTGVLCNQCYKELTKKELSVYPFQWQYSGDMYCLKHEDRPQFWQVRPPEKQAKDIVKGDVIWHIGYWRTSGGYDPETRTLDVEDYTTPMDPEELCFVKQ